MTAAGPEFYDALLENPRTPYLGDPELSPYLPMYRAAAALVPDGASVVELGCGTGRLAGILIRQGHEYTGIDFAPALVAEARRYNGGRGRFLVDDLRRAVVPAADCYVATEVFEHLDNDIGMINRLPIGSTLVISVPSFDSESHVRFFADRESARARYGEVIAIDHLEYVPIGDKGAYFHVLRGVR